MLAWKSGLSLWIRALKIPFSGSWKWALLPSVRLEFRQLFDILVHPSDGALNKVFWVWTRWLFHEEKVMLVLMTERESACLLFNFRARFSCLQCEKVSTEQHWAGMKKNMCGKQAKTAKKRDWGKWVKLQKIKWPTLDWPNLNGAAEKSMQIKIG